MKSKLAFLAALAFAGAPLTPNAASAAEATNNVAELPPRPPYWPWAVGVEAGSMGIFGAFGSWHFSDHLGLRLGADFAQGSVSGTEIAGINYDAKLRLLSEPLTLNIYPWQKHSFYIGVGLLFNQNQLTGTASDSGTIIIDGKPFPADRVGSLSMRVEQQLVNPYLSIGGNFLYFDHAHHWALGGELGVAYTGNPKVSLTRSGPLDPLIDAAVRDAQNHLQNYANQYKWWPVVKLSVSYSF